jgi:hypothetical protein
MGKLPSIKIVSGGQTGVDRAALDFALVNGIPCGGWCPRGRKAEDGPIHELYPLREMPTEAYSRRTEQNIIDSDATLVLYDRKADRGTRTTISLCLRLKKPVLYISLESENNIGEIRDWIRHYRVKVLNIAGPRESSDPGIYRKSFAFLEDLFEGPSKGPILPM